MASPKKSGLSDKKSVGGPPRTTLESVSDSRETSVGRTPRTE